MKEINENIEEKYEATFENRPSWSLYDSDINNAYREWRLAVINSKDRDKFFYWERRLEKEHEYLFSIWERYIFIKHQHDKGNPYDIFNTPEESGAYSNLYRIEGSLSVMAAGHEDKLKNLLLSMNKQVEELKKLYIIRNRKSKMLDSQNLCSKYEDESNI